SRTSLNRVRRGGGCSFPSTIFQNLSLSANHGKKKVSGPNGTCFSFCRYLVDGLLLRIITQACWCSFCQRDAASILALRDPAAGSRSGSQCALRTHPGRSLSG